MLNLFNRSDLTAVSFIRKALVLFVISQATNAQDNNSNIEQYLEEIDRIEATEGILCCTIGLIDESRNVLSRKSRL